ncbi:MAG: hypothetical protein JNK30_07395 [Phenylobacterium sp.]|uniref:hypothetical protein n=1 Tax=Phenylobacterium sp. TaxID=1871053 RepID=UPI001A5D88F6|nr:hypothetical protein [Phenylobacterium sp.]MBL8771192.1 hypothetical protein [Phenylobacterium sp.]
MAAHSMAFDPTYPELPRAWAPGGFYFERRVRVRSDDGPWRVEAEDLEPACFLSGGSAERHARRLARAYAAVGFDVTLEVLGESGELRARVRRSGLNP